jgi:RND family efflux transporter MFP subunit
MRQLLRYALPIGIAAAAAFYFLGGGGSQNRIPGQKVTAIVDQAPAVLVARAETQTVDETVLITGTVVARTEILIAPEIEGQRVVELTAEEGDRVTAGQVLARLERATIESQLAQNAANQARSEAGIAQAGSAIAQAEARRTEAVNALDRAKPLRQSGVLAESTFDTRQSAALTAEAALVSARDGLRVANADLAQIKAQRQDLEWRLSKTEVRAPVDGLISRRSAKIGALASAAADPMFRIVAKGEVELDAEVPETLLVKLKVDQTAHITLAGSRDVTGKVRLVSPEVDKASRLGRARLALGTDPGIKVGSFGRGTVLTSSATGVAVPTTAVLFGSEGSYVQLVREGQVITTKVTTGLQNSTMTQIVAGLSDGDRVVAKSGTFLRNSDKVRPILPSANTVSEAR